MWMAYRPTALKVLGQTHEVDHKRGAVCANSTQKWVEFTQTTVFRYCLGSLAWVGLKCHNFGALHVGKYWEWGFCNPVQNSATEIHIIFLFVNIPLGVCDMWDYTGPLTLLGWKGCCVSTQNISWQRMWYGQVLKSLSLTACASVLLCTVHPVHFSFSKTTTKR